jgi:FixJ family two-component response regulator
VIHIVDDDKYVLRGFQILLKSEGFDSNAYESIEDFLRLWQKGENDLLILDIHMPGLNGCDLLEYLEMRKIYLPVIVITAYDEPESRKYSESYGIIAYLLKPVDGEILINLIRNSTHALN